MRSRYSVALFIGLCLVLFFPLPQVKAESVAQLEALIRLTITRGTCAQEDGPVFCVLEAFLKDGRRLPASPGWKVAHEAVHLRVDFLSRADGVLVLDVLAYREVWAPNGETIRLRQVFVYYGGPGGARVSAHELLFQDTTLIEDHAVTPSDSEVTGLWPQLIRLFLAEPA